MARTSSLNKYLANTPYAVLSMEALESEQTDALFLSLESEITKLEALRSMRTTIQNVKGINREMALSLESIDDGILPFKAVGFTSAPSRTGLVLTQESLGRKIVEGAKKVWEIILEAIKRLGALFSYNKAASQAAREASKRLSNIKIQNFTEVFAKDEGKAILKNVVRADTSEILKEAVEKLPRDLEDQSLVVSKILAFAKARNSSAEHDIQILRNHDLDFNYVSQVLRNRQIKVELSEPSEKLVRDYFEQIEALVERVTDNASSTALFLAGTRVQRIAKALDASASTVDRLVDDMARSNENVARFIKQQPADSADWFGPDLAQALARIYRSQVKIFSLLRGHMTYCTTAVNKVNDRLDDVRKEVA